MTIYNTKVNFENIRQLVDAACALQEAGPQGMCQDVLNTLAEQIKPVGVAA